MGRKQKVFTAASNEAQQNSYCIDYIPAMQTDVALKKHFNLNDSLEDEKQLLDILDADLYYLSARDISQREGYHRIWKKRPIMNETERTCALGIRWQRCVKTAKFSVDESITSPLAGCTDHKSIIHYNWPKPDDFDFDLLHKESELFSDRAVVGGLWTGILGDAYRLVGFQHFLLSIALDPEVIHTLIKTLTDVYLELNNAYFSSLSGKMDIWFFGNDFGSQNGLLISREMWRQFFFNPIQQLCTLAHSYGLKVMMHSCGAIEPIITDLIEAGVDILDPVQVTADGMEPVLLSKKYGKEITFHGGLDTQQVLPFGSIDDVRLHVMEIVKTLRTKGRFIAAGSQILGSDIPLDNILTMYSELERQKT